MEPLENVVMSCSQCTFPSELMKKVEDSPTLSDDDRHRFNEIWEFAMASKNWNDADLTRSIVETHRKIMDTFTLSDTATAVIVRLASYEWR